jgi:hypothetical protein
MEIRAYVSFSIFSLFVKTENLSTFIPFDTGKIKNLLNQMAQHLYPEMLIQFSDEDPVTGWNVRFKEDCNSKEEAHFYPDHKVSTVMEFRNSLPVKLREALEEMDLQCRFI